MESALEALTGVGKSPGRSLASTPSRASHTPPPPSYALAQIASGSTTPPSLPSPREDPSATLAFTRSLRRNVLGASATEAPSTYPPTYAQLSALRAEGSPKRGSGTFPAESSRAGTVYSEYSRGDPLPSEASRASIASEPDRAGSVFSRGSAESEGTEARLAGLEGQLRRLMGLLAQTYVYPSSFPLCVYVAVC